MFLDEKREYEIKLPSVNRDSKLKREIETLAEVSVLRPDDLVVWAQEHRDSALASRLDWDNSSAGHRYRVVQVQEILRALKITITTPSGERVSTRQFVFSASRSKSTRGYLSVETVRQSESMYLAELETRAEDVLRDLRIFQNTIALAPDTSTCKKKIKELSKRIREACP